MQLPETRPSVNSGALIRSRTPARARVVTGLRLVGALALLATGATHLQQYTVDDYRVIPTVGALFLLNFIGATVLGLYLMAPGGQSGGPWRRAGDLFAAVSGCFIAVGSLAGLFISEQMPLFGFMEQGYRPAIVVAITVEAVTAAALGGFIVLAYGRER